MAAMHGKENGPPAIRFGPFTLDGRSGELRNGPTRLKVPDQSIAVLQALLERPGELVTREELRDRLWGPDTFVDFEAGLNAAVRRLREALNDSADVPRYVETLPAAGTGSSLRWTVHQRLHRPRRQHWWAPRLRPPHVTIPPGSDEFACGMWCSRFSRLTIIGSAVWAGLRWNDAATAAARPVPITSFPGLELDPALSPAGDLVAYAWEGGAETTSTSTFSRSSPRSRLQLTTTAAADRGPAWSPDGQRIAFVRVPIGRGQINVLEEGRGHGHAAFGGPEQQLFEANWPSTTARGMGSRGRRTASTWSLAIGLAPVPRRRSTCTRSRMVEDAAHTSAYESHRCFPRRFSRWPLSRVRAHEPVGRGRQRLSAEARAAASVGGTDPTDERPQCAHVRLDGGQPQHHP